jgi:hypothetical protein
MKQLFGVVVLVMGASMSYAQVDFSGTWILKSKEYISGTKYSNAVSERMKVIQRKDSLIVESGETNNRSSYPMDGSKASFSHLANRRKSIHSLRWEADKKTITTRVEVIVEDSPHDIDQTCIVRWRLAGDGKQLFYDLITIDHTSSWEVNAVYVKK